MNFNLSLFDNKLGTLPRPAVWSWEDFCARLATPKIRANKDGALFAPATFEPARRKKENVAELSLLVLDYDHHASLTRDTAVWRKLGLQFAVYTTHSHQRVTEEHTEAEDRFRVVFPLAEPIPAAKFPALWRWAAEQSGGKIDPAPKDVSRMFYLPVRAAPDAPYTYEIHNGDLLDWRALALDFEPVRTTSAPIKTALSANGTRYAQAALSSASQRVATAANGTRNATLNAEAFSLGQLVGAGALRESDVVGALESAAQSAGLHGREIQATIRSGIQAGAKEPRQLPESATRPPASRATKPTQADEAHAAAEQAAEDEPASCHYKANGVGLVWLKPVTSREGGQSQIPVQLTNFKAEITGDVVRDDGAETARVFEITAQLAGEVVSQKGTVSAADFASLRWVQEVLGARAIVYPGKGEHAKVAIQSLSHNIQVRRVVAHTGWRDDGEGPRYYHAGGAIGATGLVEAEVSLPPAFAHCSLPEPPTAEARIAAIRATLERLNVAPDALTIPLCGSSLSAVLTGADFSTHLFGYTGSGKTQLAALIQSDFGAGFDGQHLPAAWVSTGNSLETLAHAAKDCVLTVDDFCPTGSAADVARLHAAADRILRAQGNHAGRTRCRTDGSVRAARPPRGLIVSTGEDIPRGQSLRARMLVLEVAKDAVRWEVLTECQRAARAGLYAQAMSAFLQWLATDDRITRLQANAAEQIAWLREEWMKRGVNGHKRSATTLAQLMRAWRTWLQFAREVGAIDEAEEQALRKRVAAALDAAGKAQDVYLTSENPALRFVELIQAALSSGKAHLASLTGGEPDSERAQACGWRDGQPLGERIGWIDGEDVYLQPDAAFTTAQRLATGGEGLTVSSQTLWKRMNEAGLLASKDEARGTLKVRRRINGSSQQVVHCHAEKIAE